MSFGRDWADQMIVCRWEEGVGRRYGPPNTDLFYWEMEGLMRFFYSRLGFNPSLREGGRYYS